MENDIRTAPTSFHSQMTARVRTYRQDLEQLSNSIVCVAAATCLYYLKGFNLSTLVLININLRNGPLTLIRSKTEGRQRGGGVGGQQSFYTSATFLENNYLCFVPHNDFCLPPRPPPPQIHGLVVTIDNDMS